MSLKHGINIFKTGTNMASVKKTGVGIPFVIGASPAHTAGGYTGKPQIAYDFAEAMKKLGYSDEWRYADGSPKWELCQVMYVFFKLFFVAPVIFMNVLDPAKHKTAVSGADFAVTDHIALLPTDALIDGDLTVKAGDTTLAKGTDYNAVYGTDKTYVELVKTGSAYTAETLNIAYNKADPSKITAADIEAAAEQVEYCKTLFGIVPDLISAPGYENISSTVAVLAAKAPNINGLFRAKAVCNIDTTFASSYDALPTAKKNGGFEDKNVIACWAYGKNGDHIFDMSVLVMARMAKTDAENGCPYESPSNKELPITALCDKVGNEITLSLSQADAVSAAYGVVTALNFDGFVVWGNYMGCFPASTDVSEQFIPTSRMTDFICNTFVATFWSKLDRPMTRVLIDSVVNSFNTFLAGLTSDGKLYGGKIEYVPDNNPASDLIAGKFRLDTSVASPVPAQQIDNYVTFDVDMLVSALNG